MLEYLWKAAWSFFEPGDPDAGDWVAATAYTKALMLTSDTVERQFLASRLDELGSGIATAFPEF